MSDPQTETAKKTLSPAQIERRKKRRALARAMWQVDTQGQAKEARLENWKETRKERAKEAGKLLTRMEKQGLSISIEAN